jgi:urease accessory protein
LRDLAAGTGSVEIIRNGDRSVVARAIAVSPLRLLTPRNHGCGAWIYAATFGGGLVDGDAVRLDLVVGGGATAMLATQASTKVYRSTRSSQGTSYDLNATVSAGAVLAVLPDPVICFAASRYRQHQRIDLGVGASLVFLDWLSAGRRASGERWQFDGYSGRLEVHQDDRLWMLDSTALEGPDGELDGRMGRFNILCLIVLAGPVVASDAARAVSTIASSPIERQARLLIGASSVADGGCIIRIAGVSFEDVAAAAREYLSFVPALLGDDPWARKW